MRRRVLALAQIAPTLGDLAQNFAVHQEKIAESRAAGADLVIFPELSLTGYQLQDLAPEVAMRRTDPRLAALAKLTSGGPSAVVSFVESTDDHRLFAAAALLEGGEVRHVARKCYLPTYGLFDERRFLAAGDAIRAIRATIGGPAVAGGCPAGARYLCGMHSAKTARKCLRGPRAPWRRSRRASACAGPDRS